MNGRILVVEDDPDIANLLRINLGDVSEGVDVASDGKSGLEMAGKEGYSLIILDLMLPEIDGLEICKSVRQTNRYVPILMLTAKAEEFDKVLGLELGADDYLTKPFSIRELKARVKALYRRIEIDRESRTEFPLKQISYGPLVVDGMKRSVTLRGEAVTLTSKEFDLLHLFLSNPGRAYSRQELLDVVWGYKYSGYSHTVNTHINRLRGKIEDDRTKPRFIKTVWGVGYQFAEEDELEDLR
ncbi:MAG: response regulator transcription factor [Rhodothermales bacterium]|nr:response regulator transcription factor [Rhodothermales bacterium]